jgi:DNA mismatch repair protein MutS
MAKNKAKYTPMMMQYLAIKEQHPDTLILFRLGDFYEFFFDDAKVASKELQLVLTGRSAGSKQRVPMCGVPHHAVNGYINKLIKRGHKVGIVEQLEEASSSKSLVDRGVIQIMTPGAYIDSSGTENNYITAIDDHGFKYVLAYGDVTTGEINVTNIEHDLAILQGELDNLLTREIVVSSTFDKQILEEITQRNKIIVSLEDEDQVELEWEPLFELVKDGTQMKTVARLIHYLQKTQRRSLSYLKPINVVKKSGYLQIDAYSRNNLELIKSMRLDERYGSLLWLLDETNTPMGKRLLRQWIISPSADINVINQRLDMVETLIDQFMIKEQLKKQLSEVYDLERLIARISYGNANGKDMLQIRDSLALVPEIKTQLTQLDLVHFKRLNEKIESLANIYELLNRAINEDAPISVKEGGIFKKGYDKQLDELLSLASGSKKWISELEARERQKTGIKNLKVGYNRVFGYYIEVSSGNLAHIKSEYNYQRKQTLTTSERFVTTELQEKEHAILRAEEQRIALEYELFVDLRKTINKETRKIQFLSSNLALIDVLISLSNISSKYEYVRPQFNSERLIDIKEGRHPVIERVMKINRFVKNDLYMNDKIDVLLITGPNMGGKSTYMRQLALIVILAQIGCFVPAKSANLMIFDQIFTRIGASDDLVSGQSTFMVEMSETNHALAHASDRSLLIFDEIGRGTATYDGMALAQAIIEYITSSIHAKTLFSTHYHELTMLEKEISSLQNVQVTVAEDEEKITFLYKVAPGAMNKSYGINVAKLAHLPPKLLNRAAQILINLETRKLPPANNVLKKDDNEEDKWIKEVKEIDPLQMSPLEALQFLYEIKKKIK